MSLQQIYDSIFDPFQNLSDENQIRIGMPTKASDGINISMLIFQPNDERITYSKRLLHFDELPYFVSSNNQPSLKIKISLLEFVMKHFNENIL
ncbi:hypothetical protein DSM03_11226 [Leeuwenhoekiella aestuarii]|uniref:Uncharacterized protein n=1 Tax=Leeuwenhoekiella aestuarii TaxID=2249426 RepID=A0A4Q0NQC6_9FLAO|nr:hypothetical protein DSM04_11024 [Leeuwenhoekiella aestuarii]RXG12049.1 hypothetical protein DSM03_11226 [Leeuwenhoekiella aestuarii]